VTFAYPLPWWAIVLVAAAILGLAISAYLRSSVVLSPAERLPLILLRALTLATVVVMLMRPVAPLPPAAGAQGIVAVLVDTSRSMSLNEGRSSRFAAAVMAARERILPDLARGFAVDTYSIGERVARADLDHMSASDRASNLTAAVREIRDRYRDRSLVGIVLLSDGGETGDAAVQAKLPTRGPPVVTVGVGPSDVHADREIRSVTTGPSAFDASLVEITATLVGHGVTGPASVRLTQDGRVIELRDVVLPGDGTPVQAVFTVPQDRALAAVCRLEVAPAPGELTTANNAADVLVAPPARPRRLLIVEGLPGFEHAFLKRAWRDDPSLEVDAVVRKGQNEHGQSTFYVQADPARTAALGAGFPVTREALFAYDVIVFAGAPFDALTRDQLGLVADFVSNRGGGVLVVDAAALLAASFSGSPLQAVLPLDPTDRRAGIVQTALESAVDRLRVTLTPEGARHPIMRIAANPADIAQRWAAMPALAGATVVGAPRPGATVLAMTETASGTPVPLVAVQRYGGGRAMIFTGEASWHWKMRLPAADHSFETFWRQAVRWLAGGSADPVELTAPFAVAPGGRAVAEIRARDEAFEPVPDASIQVTLHAPDGSTRELPVARDTARPGSFRAEWLADRPGVFRVSAAAHRGSTTLGTAETYVLGGGIDAEFSDPRLNRAVLERLSTTSGGRYLSLADVDRVGAAIRAGKPAPVTREYRDLWHTGWSFLIVIGLLAAEWLLRRRLGLR
jgi:uncharacterized membrane protein